MRFVNCTPHEVTIRDGSGKKLLNIPPYGPVVRLKTISTPIMELAGISVVVHEYAEPEGLPDDLEPGDILIVSEKCLDAVRKATARKAVIVVAPDTSPESAVRDEDGRIIGVKRFVLAAGTFV